MPWSAIAVLTTVLVGSGLLLVWIGRQSTAGTLKRNRLAGIHTRATLASDEAWRAAHLAGGPAMTWAGVVSTIAGLVFLSRPSNTIGLVILIAAMAVMLTLVAVSAVKGQRAAKSVHSM